jgi:hypothetical protein
MRNFLHFASGVDTLPLLLEVQRQPELWGKNPARMSRKAPHYETQDIVLRSKDERPCLKDYTQWLKFSDQHIPKWYKSVDFLPSARKLVYDLMRATNAESLGSVFIYRLQPGTKIYPHVDGGWHAEFHDKFNICLQSNPKAQFIYDDEVMTQRPGDVHHFRNDVNHSVVNDGDCDHIVMIVSLRLDRGERVPWSPEGWSIDKQGDEYASRLG